MTYIEIYEKHRSVLISGFKLDLFQMWAFVARRRPEFFSCKNCSLWIMCAVIYWNCGKAAYLLFIYFPGWYQDTDVTIRSKQAGTGTLSLAMQENPCPYYRYNLSQMSHHSLILYLILHICYLCRFEALKYKTVSYIMLVQHIFSSVQGLSKKKMYVVL